MDDAQLEVTYSSPQVADYGRLHELTGSAHLFMAAPSHDLGFSGASGTGGTGGTTTTGTPTGTQQTLNSSSSSPGGLTPGATGVPGHAGVAHHGLHGTHDSGGAGGGGSGGGSAAGSGGHSLPGLDRLPFTGFPVAVTGALGSGLVATGAYLRRLARRDPAGS